MRMRWNRGVARDVPWVMKPRFALLMTIVLLAAACGGERGPDGSLASGSGSSALEVVQEVECCYSEGSLSHVRLRTGDGEVVAEREFGPGPLIQVALEVATLAAGTYVLESWQRPCSAACPPQGGLDPVTDRCDAEFAVSEDQRVEALIEVDPGAGCAIIVGDGVAETSGDGAVHGLDPETGAQLWSVDIGGSMVDLVAAGAGHAYLVSAGDPDVLHAIRLETGEIAWRHDAAGWWPPGGEAVAGDTLYATVWDGSTLALDAATGEERWRADTPGEGPSAPAVAGAVVVVGTDTEGNLYGLDASTGERRWHRRLDGGIPAAPMATGDRVYLTLYGGSSSGSLVAVEAASGATVWEASLPGSVLGGPAVADGHVYAGSGSVSGDSGTVQAFDAATGQHRWSVTLDGVMYNTPSVADGRVLAADLHNDGSANLYAFTATTGELAWTMPLPGEMRGAPFLDQGRAYVTAHPAHLLVLDIEDGTILDQIEANDLSGDVDDLTAPHVKDDILVVGSS